MNSYRPISLLPSLSKVFEKLLLKRLKPFIDPIIPQYQFGFREKHSTIQQIHRIATEILLSFERKLICSSLFLDFTKAFDKVWLDGLIYKIKQLLPVEYAFILESYVQERMFRVKMDNEYSTLRRIQAGVPQGSILGPTLYLLFTYDMPTTNDVKLATFADDTTLITSCNTMSESVSNLQAAADRIFSWTKTWGLVLNEKKTTLVHFTTRRNITEQPIYINNVKITPAHVVKYLGMTMDSKLTWGAHIETKIKELRLKSLSLHSIFAPNSPVSQYNKVLIYNQIIKPAWYFV